MEREFLSKELARQFVAGEKTIRKLLARLGLPLEKLDRTLLGALETSQRKMLYHLDRLRGKAARAQNFRTGLLDAHERQLTGALYPHHSLQERTLCFLRSEEHTSELQSRLHLVCRLLLEKKK